jgi:peptide/nickel transport system substrate-binding protein
MACTPSPGVSETEDAPLPSELASPPTQEATSLTRLTANPVEESAPIYGGTLRYGFGIPTNFDAHQKISYGASATAPVFNQLIMYDVGYKQTTIETIIGDLAERWETSADGLEINFYLYQGVKWHDGVLFNADDVVYSIEKMMDSQRSGIASWFPAYQSIEKINDYTVKVHLKYPSVSFMLMLAQGECQIQAAHLSGTDYQSTGFMVGTGPYILTEYLPGVHLKFKRNPDYFKKDKYGNQLPYLDGLNYYHVANEDSLIARRLDVRGILSGASSLSTYTYLKNAAPELVWQRKERYSSAPLFINTAHAPFNDIRVRRALALVLNEEDMILGYSDDLIFGSPGSGILHPDFGLPKEEISKLLGWDKTWDERVAEAQSLLAEAGVPSGFKLDIMAASSGTTGPAGASLVYAEVLRKYLNIDAEVFSGLGTAELLKRAEEGNYDIYAHLTTFTDPTQIALNFGTNGIDNWSNYSNPELDQKMEELDKIFDPAQRQEAIWAIERILLTDLPALPTGTFCPYLMPYYSWVKNLRFNNMAYSASNRLEDVWIDKSAVIDPSPTPTPTPTLTPTPTSTPTTSPSDNQTGPVSYDNPDWPVIWVSVDPVVVYTRDVITIKLKVPPGSSCSLVYITPLGTRIEARVSTGVADSNGDIVLKNTVHSGGISPGQAFLELTNIKTDNIKIVVTYPITAKRGERP